LIIVNVVIFILCALTLPGQALYEYLALWPFPHTRFWQLVSYGFLHGGLLHLAFNMIGFWIFGRVVERQWGSIRYLVYYFVCVFGAAVASLYTSYMLGHTQITVGASGGVLGLVLAFGLMFPDARLVLFPIPYPVKAKWALVGFVVVSVVLIATDTLPRIAHYAHLGGMVSGWILIQYWRRTSTRF